MSQSPDDQYEAFALIVDPNEAAAADTDEARQTAQQIYYLTGAEQFKLFVLGRPAPISPLTLKRTVPPGGDQRAQACRLIAPVMEALVREEQKYLVIIVGSGEIVDLDDWVGDPRIDGWLLVRTGERASLQRAGGRVAEVTPNQISDDADTLLSYFSRFDAGTTPPAPRGYYPGDYKWQADASGYPLIFVEPLGAYVHLFPVAKPQFEKFLVSGRQQELDHEWYAQRLGANPRASYRSQNIPALEQLFMTDVSPDEALAFGRWLGRDYKLLTADEWCACREWFAGQPAPSTPLNLAAQLSQDALAIWDLIEGHWTEQQGQMSLQELSLMKQGILEWVVKLPGQYWGLGDPAAARSLRKFSDLVRPLGTEPLRLKNLGFRLRAR